MFLSLIQEYCQCVSSFGPRDILSGLIWVQTVSKSNNRTTAVVISKPRENTSTCPRNTGTVELDSSNPDTSMYLVNLK